MHFGSFPSSFSSSWKDIGGAGPWPPPTTPSNLSEKMMSLFLFVSCASLSFLFVVAAAVPILYKMTISFSKFFWPLLLPLHLWHSFLLTYICLPRPIESKKRRWCTRDKCCWRDGSSTQWPKGREMDRWGNDEHEQRDYFEPPSPLFLSLSPRIHEHLVHGSQGK